MIIVSRISHTRAPVVCVYVGVGTVVKSVGSKGVFVDREHSLVRMSFGYTTKNSPSFQIIWF